MSKAYKGPHSLVLASVKPGRANHPAVKVAADLCRRTGMRLRLIAAIEPTPESNLRYGSNEGFDFSALGRNEREDQRAAAEDELRRVAQDLETGSQVEISVVFGAPAQAILSDAVVSGASLIITGAAKGRHQFVPKGLSTALTLMADSPVPVLVVNDESQLDVSRKNLTILVADDLSESCERAVLVAFDLATALGKTDVSHVYANALTMDNFVRNVQKLRALRRQEADADIGPTELWDQTHRDLLERLPQRAPGRTHFLEAAGGHYKPEIRDGGVEDELGKAIDATAPDIITFGRHQPLHRRPFAIGRMPFHFMLSQNRAILVVPPE